MTEKEVLEILHQVGAVITGSHFIYTSGKHGSAYVNKDAIYPHTQLISKLCEAMAEPFLNKGVEAVLAPAVGGVILSQWTAHTLTQRSGREVLGIYAEKAGDGESFVIRRGYDQLIRERKVLVVEDILTTGGSVKKVVEAARGHAADVVAVAALCNRGGVTAQDLGSVPQLFSLLRLSFEAWEKEKCPLCAQQVPVNPMVGKRKS